MADEKKNDAPATAYVIHGVDPARIKAGLSLSDLIQQTTKAQHETSPGTLYDIDNAVMFELKEDNGRITEVPGLKTTLYPSQQASLHSIRSAEDRRRVKLFVDSESTEVCVFENNAGVFSDPVGSGKTIVIISLILISPCPKARPDIVQLQSFTSFRSKGAVRYRYRTLLKPTLIFAGASVVNQWFREINKMTDLGPRTFEVHGVRDLRKLFEMMDENRLNANYDIVVVKNGVVTADVTLPRGADLDEVNKKSSPHIYNLIANCRNYCWARVIIDDFDTIGLPQTAGIVRSLFTWYVSSTRKKAVGRATKQTYTRASDWLSRYNYGCAQVMYNNLLFRTFNVRNSLQFIKSSTHIPAIKYHACVFKNPEEAFLSMMNAMGNDDVNRVTEMLNSGALETAAETVGIKAKTPVDVFKALLGQRFEAYKLANDVLEFIGLEEEEKHARLGIKHHPDYDEDDIPTYGKKNLLAWDPMEYKYPGLKGNVEAWSEEYTEEKRVNGTEIDRVKANILHGNCPGCERSLQDAGECIILKCCDILYCAECGMTRAQNFGDRYNRLESTCSACRKNISIRDLVYIGDQEVVLSVMNDEYDDPESDDDEKKEQKSRDKYDALLDVIRGQAVTEGARLDMHLPNMMKGNKYLVDPPYRKVLIFSNYDESIKKIQEFLGEQDVPYWRLGGGPRELARIADEYSACESNCVLLINSSKHSAGLNLQTSTDLVFFHYMIDPNVTTQVVGRGQRIGRTSNLNVWFMCYDNEYDQLKTNHDARLMEEAELTAEIDAAGGSHTILEDVEENPMDVQSE
jgi:hypothetical protein